MKVTIVNKVIELKVNTISLAHNAEKIDNVELFRCTNCGGAVAQYQGRVVKIYPHTEPTEEVRVINECRRCGTLYSFQTFNKYKVGITKTVLLIDPLSYGHQKFLCYVCRQPLLEFDANIIVDITKPAKVVLPYRLKCPTVTCPADYQFLDVV